MAKECMQIVKQPVRDWLNRGRGEVCKQM